MIHSIHKKQSSILYKALCGFIALTFLASVILPPTPVFAQTVLNLPVPGTMVPPSSGFAPALMTGVTINPDNPLRFDFIMDRGQSDLAGEPLKEEYTKIIKYFMASLTVPEDQMWVNLSPYEKDRMVAEGLGQTEMGRDMLAQDYLLKQLTASLMYPEKELGKKFWDRIYKKAKEQFGTTEIPVNTFNKVWIVPDEALVYEQGTSAFVIKSRLAVMLEQDYEAMSHKDTKSPGHNDVTGDVVTGDVVTTQIIREVIIPEIEKEVNEGKNFANLRQIYNALILATWYKQRLKDSLLGKVYVDQNKTKGIDTQDKEINQKIYDQYIESFKKGVYNFIKEDVDSATQEVIPRKYFSGGMKFSSSPIKGKLELRPLDGVAQRLGLTMGAALLAFGVSSVAWGDIQTARASANDGNEDVVPTAFVENTGSDARIVVGEGVTEPDAAIVVNKNVQPALLAQANEEKIPSTSASSPVSGQHRIIGAITAVSLLWGAFVPAANALEMSLWEKFDEPAERARMIDRIALGIVNLEDERTGLAPSHLGHPGFEKLKFVYDAAVDALVLKAAGKQKEAEKVLDYFADRLEIPLQDIVPHVDTNGIAGILKVWQTDKFNVRGLINALDRTSTKPRGQGMLEYYSTPGPMAFIVMAFLNVNRERYLPVAVSLGDALLSLQRADGGLRDGDRSPTRVHIEPHMDSFATFLQLYQATKDQKWKAAAEKAWQFFVKSDAYHPKEGIIWQGIWESGTNKIFATDAYSWTMAGPAGDRMSLFELEKFTETMLSKSLTSVTLELPDGKTRTVILVDFADPKDPRVVKDREGFHPMGTVEWVGGVIAALQKNAVRFWEKGDPQQKEKARHYKAVAEYLTANSLNSFYEIPGLEGLLSFYATGQNVQTGHGWRTPFFYVKGPQTTIRGGSLVSAWPVLPIQGLNPFEPGDAYKQSYDTIPLSTEDKERAIRFVALSVVNRSFKETVPTRAVEAAAQIVEPGNYNLQMWHAFIRGDYKKSIEWATKVINESDWTRLAKRDQERKAEEIGGIVKYPWGQSPSSVPNLESAIWRYPLLNEVAAAMWGLAAANFELGNNSEAKKWMRRIITEVPYHQIFAPEGPGYWNALVSWEYNPGHVRRDAQMGVLYREVLREMGLSSAAPKEVLLSHRPAVTPPKPQTPPAVAEKPPEQQPARPRENIWLRGVAGEYSSQQWQAKATFSDFDPPLKLKGGQKIKISYSLQGSNILGIQLIPVGVSEGMRGDMIVKQGVEGANKTIVIEVPSDRNVWRIAFQYGKNAWGPFGGSISARFEVHSLEILDEQHSALETEDKSASSPVTLNQLREELIGFRARYEMANPEWPYTLAKFDALIKIIEDTLENKKGVTFQNLRESLFDLYRDLPSHKFSYLRSEITQYINGLGLGGEGQVSHSKMGALIDASIRELDRSTQEKVPFRGLFSEYLDWLGGFIAKDAALTYGNFYRFVHVFEMGNHVDELPAVQELLQAIYELQFGGYKPPPTTPPAAASPVEKKEPASARIQERPTSSPMTFDEFLQKRKSFLALHKDLGWIIIKEYDSTTNNLKAKVLENRRAGDLTIAYTREKISVPQEQTYSRMIEERYERFNENGDIDNLLIALYLRDLLDRQQLLDSGLITLLTTINGGGSHLGIHPGYFKKKKYGNITISGSREYQQALAEFYKKQENKNRQEFNLKEEALRHLYTDLYAQYTLWRSGLPLDLREYLLSQSSQLQEDNVIILGQYVPKSDPRHDEHNTTQLILRFKNGDEEAIQYFYKSISDNLHALKEKGISFDLAVAIPSHSSDTNPLEKLADQLFQMGDVSNYVPAVLLETGKKMGEQKYVKGSERIRNVAGAWEVDKNAIPYYVEGKRILLIDDVMTSGATLEEVKAILYSAGAEVVIPIVLGRTGFASSQDSGSGASSSPVEMEPVVDAFEVENYDMALRHLDHLITDTKPPEILAKLNEAKEKIGQIKTLARRVASQKEGIPETVAEKIKFEEARLERLQEMAADSAGREVTLGRLRISIDKVENSIRDMARQTPKAEIYLKSRELLAKNRSRILSRLRELEAFLETVAVEARSEEVIADFPAPVEKSLVQADVPTEDAVEIDTLSAAKENFWKSRNLAEAGAALKNLRIVYTKAHKMSLEDLLKDTEIKSPTTLYESFDKGKTLVYQLAQPQGDIVYQRGDVNPMLVRYAQRLTLIDGEHAEEDFVRFLRDLSGIEPTISLQVPLSADDLWEIPADVTTWEDLIYFWEYARSRLLDLGKMNILGHRFNGGNGQQKLANFKKNPAKYLSEITEQEAKKWGELVKINGDEMWEAIERIKKTEEVKKREAKYRSQEVPEEDDTPLAMPPQQGSSKEALWDEVLQKVQESEKGRPVLQPRKEEDIPLLPYIPKEVKNFESFGRFIKERMAELGKSPALVAAQIGVTAPTVTVFYYQGKYLYSKREGNARRILGKMKRLAYALKIEEAVFLERIAELQAQGEKPAPAASAKTPITILQPSVLAQLAPEVIVTPQADVALPPQIVVPPVSDEIIQDLFDLTKEGFEAEKESEVGEILRGLLEDYPGVSQEQIDPALDRVVAMLREDAQKPRVIAPVSDEIIQNLFDLSKEEFDSEKESEVREILRELLKDYPGVSQKQIDPALDRVVTMLRDSRKVFVPAGATAMSLAADTPVPVTSQTEKTARRPSSAQGDTLAKKIAQLNEKDAAIVRKFIEDMEKLGFKGDAIFKVKFDEINRQYNRMSKESHRTLFKVYGEVMSLLKHPVIIEFKNGARSSSPVAEPPGGIDLNPALLDLQIRRDDNGVPLPLPLQPVETMHIDGFLPVIINITPISNLPLVLGLADTGADAQEARPAPKAREIEPISLLN